MIDVSKRNLLKMGGIATAAVILPGTPAWARIANDNEVRCLSFYHAHTGETIKNVTYYADGHYIPESIDQLNHLLRDFRTDDVINMDKELYDILFAIQTSMDCKDPFTILSAYRSPKTNAMLRSRSKGVAKKSYHLSGKALDIRLPNRSIKQIHKAALALGAGGVGYYPKSNFVHVDTGRVRSW